MKPPQIISFSYVEVPTILKFAQDDSFIRGLCGPFGSGKSSGCVTEIIRRAMAQEPGPDGVRRTRWAVIRNTYRQLEDTTIKTFMDWVPHEKLGNYRKGDHTYVIDKLRAPDGGKVEIEVLFRALDRPDQVDNLLSLELTGAWVNEAREVPKTIIDALGGRVGRYPSKINGGATWYGIFMDTNPPDDDSWWFKLFEENRPENCAIFKQPAGDGPDAENLPNLPTNYYQNISVGKDPDWIKVYVKGQYGYVKEGKPVYSEYNDSIHTTEKAVPIKGLTIYRGWDFGLCYDDQTEVLTTGGWKFFKDVSVGNDMVATRNPKTKALEYTKINFKTDEPYKGKMLEWDNKSINMCVTPEHRIPYTTRGRPDDVKFKKAQELAKEMTAHRYVDLTAEWNKGRKMLSDAAVKMLGYYLSEGSCNKNRVTIYQKDRKIKWENILQQTGEWKWCDSNIKTRGWQVHDPGLAMWLKQFGTSGKKFVPTEIKFAPKKQIKQFIMAYTEGDGHIRTRKNGAVEHTIFTTSKRMAGDLQELALKVGWNASVHWRKPQESNLDGRIIKSKGGWAITFKKRAQRAELLKESFREIDYDGRIYCLNVPYHTLYVRRGGKAHWNGNTPCCIFSQMHPNGQWVIFDELVSEDMGIERFSEEVITYCHKYDYLDAPYHDIGDPSGEYRSDTDETSCFDILHGKGIIIEGGLTQDPDIRIECVKKPLNTMVNGAPGLILHPDCISLRKGFMGKYQFRRMQTANEKYTNKPDKNEYSHPHDALQYAATLLFGSALKGTKKKKLDLKSIYG